MELDELLARAVTKPSSSTGKLIVAYGDPGIGKTSMFCQAPNTLLIECKDYSSDALKESGIIRADLPVIKATGFYDGVDAIRALASGQHGFRNVVIDGASGMADWLDAEVRNNEFEGDPAKYVAFGRGDAVSALRWQEFADAVIDLVNSGVWVFLLCHKQVATVTNSEGNDYLRSTLSLEKKKIAPFTRYVDAVLFMSFIVGEKSVNKLTGVAKAVGGDKRVMYTQISAAYEAKNRLNLPPMIDLGSSPQEGFKAFVKAIKDGKAQKEAK